jgi:hypothetical protein
MGKSQSEHLVQVLLEVVGVISTIWMCVLVFPELPALFFLWSLCSRVLIETLGSKKVKGGSNEQ